MNITDTIYRMLPSVRPASHCRGETRAAKRRSKRQLKETWPEANRSSLKHRLARGKVLDDRRAALAQQLRAWRTGGKP